MSLFDVRNKCVLITGSSRGIGNALAAGFASAGSRVILNGKSRDNLERAVAELKKISPQVTGYRFDVTDYDEVRNTIQKIEEVPLKRWGRPEELLGTSIFLASEASSFINGFTIYVDGGWQASL